MNKSIWKQIMPHAIAVGIFLIVAVLYCQPTLEGMVVEQHDMIGVKGMAQQSVEFKEEYGKFPLWTNSMFSGMPAYQIAIEGSSPISYIHIGYLDVVLKFLPSPANLFFIASICFYILCCSLGVSFWIRLFGALSYAYASYNVILAQVGHITKLASIGYAPLLIAGIILLIQKRYWIGFAVSLIASSLLIQQNHPQMVYYFGLVVVCIGCAFAIKTIKEKDFKHLAITGGLVISSLIIGLFTNAVIMFSTLEYSKETMRGGRSELMTKDPKAEKNKTRGGLDKDYAFAWSCGIGESMTTILPEYLGGSSSMREITNENSHTGEALQSVPQQISNYLYNYLSPYWGNQSNTSGPVYFGICVCIFFIIGLFAERSWHIQWLVAATIIGFVLAWGSNLSSINYFLFDHMPLLKKFRAPSQALVIPQFTFSVLAVMALQRLFCDKWDKQVLLKKMKVSAIAVGCIILVLTINYFTASFNNQNDRHTKDAIISSIIPAENAKSADPAMVQQVTTMISGVFNGLENDRKDLYKSDLIKLLIYTFIIGLIIWIAVFKRKLKLEYALAVFAILTLIDLISVDSRYLNSRNYVTPDDMNTISIPTNADLAIKQDTGYFRVFDRTSGNPFSDSRPSYFHNSIAGYHPAKLGLYQDIIEHQLATGNMAVYNMLNTKYFILNHPDEKGQVAQLNPNSLGPCWIVKNIKYVNNADEEMASLNNISPLDTVYIDKREKTKVRLVPAFDSTATIKMIINKNDFIEYTFTSRSNQFAVFSEIYYPYGWKAYIDGKETPIARVDYAFRGLSIPAGNHKIIFEFKPKRYYYDNLLGNIFSILTVLLLIICIVQEIKKHKKNSNQLNHS